jgi:RecA/RadA recombinase
MANKWLKQLRAYEDVVNYEYDSFAEENCLYTPSPYFNWIFANKSHGCPKNASILFFSEPKAGKSLSCYSMVYEMQRRDPEGIALYFNAELRGQLQYDVFSNIDKDRLVIYDTNSPKDIFDRIENDFKPLIQDGMPIRMIIIDSLNGVIGVKRLDAESVENHLIGDKALTLQVGLEKLVPFCKRNKILLIGTAQMRANLDAGYGGPKEKMAASWASKFAFEYYISLKRAGAADDKVDIEGKTFEEDDMKDARGNKLLNGHKIYCKMEGSSIGPQGRSGVFTMSYDEGIVNQHEEIFWLGKNTGVITTTNNRTYFFGNNQFNGKKECALAIRDNPELAAAILEQVKLLDKDK